MGQEMLVATQQAAWAAQSAAQAAWWALAVNGAVVVVAIGTTFFQEWRVSRRTAAGQIALHKGAVDTVGMGWRAIQDARSSLEEAHTVTGKTLAAAMTRLDRSRRLIALFTAREVDPQILAALLTMDDLLAQSHQALQTAAYNANVLGVNAEALHGFLAEPAHSAHLIFTSLA